ncbi:hypothetical protein ATK74_0569 [Propionicimonas paludicola]|uniref:Uncharacterized protein n=1 Tax=Propionicimonas paludicola TaxID=185243 RepID=A0A2A9CNP7_9ACTN|nr:hypothetical protein ATK74_0569 [Propionicimonas paludicola]
MLLFGGGEVRVAADGLTTRLIRGKELVAELSWVGAAPSSVELIADDEVEHVLASGGARLLQRVTVAETWRTRWVLVRDHGGDQAVDERLRVQPGPEYTLWSWATGVTALLAIAPAHGAGPVLCLRLEQGHLELVDPEPGRVAAEFQIAAPGTMLGTGERLVTVIEGSWQPNLAALETRLPAWLGDTQLDHGCPWRADLADFGITAPDDVELGFSEGAVLLDGPPGRRLIEVHTPRGLSRIPVEWVPPAEQVLHQVAVAALDSARPLSGAAALCIQRAAERHAVWLEAGAHDRLDRFDWANDDSIFAAAFALARGRSEGEAAVVSDGLRVLGARATGVGFGRLAMAGWLASLSVGLDARERCLELLGRPAVGRTAALESSLLHYRSIDFGQAELAGVYHRLGGTLPGRAPLLSWSEIASLVGLLELCPPEWPGAVDYAQAAEKARGQILCAYLDGEITDPEPLAWLLFTPELVAAG